MNNYFLFFILFMCSLSVGAQSCYQETRKEAIGVFSQKNFKRAKQIFNAAKTCPDKPAKNDLNYWIGRCDKALNPKTQAVELSFAQKLALYDAEGDWHEGMMAVTKKSDWEKYYKLPEEKQDYSNDNLPNLPKVGFINEKGDLVIPCQFISSGLVPVPFFNQVNYFSDGLACVAKVFEQGDDWYWAVGYIDKQGKTVIPFDFSSALHFSEGLAAVCVEDLYYDNLPSWFFINQKGERAFDGVFLDTQSFHEGLCAVRKDSVSGWGFIDKTGRMVVEGKYNRVGDFKNGVAPVFSKEPKEQEYMCSLVDITGSEVGSCQFRPEYLDWFQLRDCISYYADKEDANRYFISLKQWEKNCKDENDGKWDLSKGSSATYACDLGNLYRKGLGGAVKNTDIAIQYWKEAADYHPHCYFRLGYLYAELQEYENSRNYYQKLIDAESKQKNKTYSASALYNIGVQYYSGQGTERNYQTAMDYFQRAKDAGGKSNCDDMIKKCKEQLGL